MRGFGARLRGLREKRGLTQEELGHAIGAHWTQVSRYERDVQLPTADRLVAMIKVLRVSADGLLLGQRNGEEPIEFKNVRLYERFRALDELSKEAQETVVRLVDAVLAQHEFQHLAERTRPKTGTEG